jgi:hypothetical protein
LTQGKMTKIMLCGLTDKDAADLLPLAKSWLRAPKVQDVSDSFQSDGYDPTQRAYLLRCKESGKPGRLEFDLAASQESPLNNLCLVVKNWGKADAELQIDGQAVPRGKQFRVGHRETIEGADLVVWIEHQAARKVRLAITPQGSRL